MNELKDLKSEKWSREEPTEGFPSGCAVAGYLTSSEVVSVSSTYVSLGPRMATNYRAKIYKDETWERNKFITLQTKS